ncbi:fibronectin type III domain-containing protein, partial [uncultured Paraglaciecola sp.]|uniref:fibronectin type III domain-containing protein n=1 Tax=uncultured Paraglaciecola sp. TaxID=1765024 RepID=UPI002634A56D
ALATAGLNGAIGYATDASGASAPTGIPTIGTITKTETTATIPFSYAEGDEVDGFDLRVGGVTITDEGTDNPIVLTGLTAGTAYTVEVRAYNTTGDGSWSSVVGFTTDSVEHNDVNLSFNVSANIKMSGVKSAADSVELPLAVNVRADGFKESAGSSAFDTATQVAVSGTKHSVGELGILQGLNAILTGVKSAGGNALVTTATHIQTGGIKHSPGQINITAYAIVGWQGSSEVTRLGSITIQAAVGVAFGGIKHANEAVSFNTLASANIKGVKHSSGDINIRAKQYIGINATKSATGIIAFNAAAMIDWAGYSSQTPTRVTLISMHGVVQSLHLNGIKKSINLRGYL